MRRAGREQRMRQATPGRSLASFNEQRELIYKACLRQPQDEWIPASAHQILKVDKEAFTGFSHMRRVGVLNTISLSQGCVLEAASGSGKGQRNPHQRTGEGVRSLRVPESSPRVSRWSHPGSVGGHVSSMTFPNAHAYALSTQSSLPRRICLMRSGVQASTISG